MNVDRLSFQLGMINAFAEMVAAGVKPLAISPPLLPEDHKALREASEAIVAGSGVRCHLETSLLVTDLQSPDFTRGKWSVLYYRDPEVLEAYRALKARQEELAAAGRYGGEARREISRAFMRLLGYPDSTIAAKLAAGGKEDPFMLPNDWDPASAPEPDRRGPHPLPRTGDPTMRILILNPNSDPEMTAAIQAAAEAFADGAFEVVTLPTPGAPRFIDTYGDKVQSGPGMLRILEENEEAFDAFVVACHSDPNLGAARELTRKPVIGIGEASMKLASFLGHSFSVVTTHQHSVPGKLAQARASHLQDLLVSVRAPRKGEESLTDLDLFLELSRRAVEEDGAEVIVLGCAGLSGMDRRISEALDVPVLDGVVCALILATGFARYGVGTSRVMGYNPDY